MNYSIPSRLWHGLSDDSQTAEYHNVINNVFASSSHMHQGLDLGGYTHFRTIRENDEPGFRFTIYWSRMMYRDTYNALLSVERVLEGLGCEFAPTPTEPETQPVS